MAGDRPRVFVTGASGFIASWIVKDLLAQGYRVRGSVRDPGQHSSVAHLLALDGADDRLEIVKADLLDASAFDSAMAGCEFVIHAASPYALNVQDPARDLVLPAVQGTRNVLSACQRAGVARVVLTSSMAAITDEPDSSRTLTEADWNTKSTLTRNPYYYSKVLAEREAWTIAERAAMTSVLNPSNQVIADILSGAYPGILSMAWGFVDVRDVARAHVLALQVASATGRYLCAAEVVSMRQTIAILREHGYADAPFSTRAFDHSVGNLMARLASWFQPPGIGSYLRTHIGRVPRLDNSKIRTELGLTFRPVVDSITETAADLSRWRHIDIKGRKRPTDPV
jgi:dihydroflavonol-4-reductase